MPLPMPHTFTCLYVHVVFGTRFRRAIIPTEIRPRLWSYMGGIARDNKARALTINGMGEHAHLLLSLHPAASVAKAVQEIKAGSSAWMNTAIGKDFRWQEGYSAFSVSLSNLEAVRNYIDRQEEHHRKIDFAAEWNLLLAKHGIVLPARS